MQTRNKRIKTDFSIHYPQKQHPILNKKSSQKNKNNKSKQRSPTYLPKIINTLKPQIQYQQMTTNQIRIQNTLLHQKLHQLTTALSKSHTKQLQLKVSHSRIINKSSFKHILNTSQSQHTLNLNLINKYNQQLKDNQQRLKHHNDYNKQLNYDRKREQIQVVIKALRQQLIRMKKNKNLRQKELLRYQHSQTQQLQQLRNQYVNMSKKYQYMQQRQKNQRKDIDTIENNLKNIKETYNQVYKIYNDIIQEQAYLDQQENTRQAQVQYNTKNKKIELMKHILQRQQQTKKRKYYAYLLDYQTINKNNNKLEEKIELIKQQNQKQKKYIQQLMQMIDQVKYQSINHKNYIKPRINSKVNSIQTNDSSFFVTNINNTNKLRQSQPKNIYYDTPIKQIYQNNIQNISNIDHIQHKQQQDDKQDLNELSNYITSKRSQKRFNNSIKRGKIRKWNNTQISQELQNKELINKHKKQYQTNNNQNKNNINNISINLRQKIKKIRNKTEVSSIQPNNKIKINQFNHNNNQQNQLYQQIYQNYNQHLQGQYTSLQ